MPDPEQCAGVAEGQRVGRQQLAIVADWIKMYGSTGSDKYVTGFQTFGYEELKAAADVAHAGKRTDIYSYDTAALLNTWTGAARILLVAQLLAGLNLCGATRLWPRFSVAATPTRPDYWKPPVIPLIRIYAMEIPEPLFQAGNRVSKLLKQLLFLR